MKTEGHTRRGLLAPNNKGKHCIKSQFNAAGTQPIRDIFLKYPNFKIKKKKMRSLRSLFTTFKNTELQINKHTSKTAIGIFGFLSDI